MTNPSPDRENARLDATDKRHIITVDIGCLTPAERSEMVRLWRKVMLAHADAIKVTEAPRG